MSNLILDTLTSAAQTSGDSNIADAYRQLAHVVGVTLTGQPLAPDKPLTPTQIIFLRNALNHLSPAQLTPLLAAADLVQQAVSGVIVNASVTGNTVVNQHIDTVSGGTVSMIGIQNTNGVPKTKGDTLPKPPNGFAAAAQAAAKMIQFEGKDAPPADHGQVEWAHDVFISYSRKDGAWARRVYADLRSNGLLVWMDDQLTPGTPSWQTALEKAIRAAGCVVVLLSPAAKASEWLEREINFAQTHHRPIVPLLVVGDEKSSIPLALSNIQWTPIRDGREYRANFPRVVTAVREFNS